MANGIVTLAGSRLYTSMADTDEIIDEALNRFEDVFKLVQKRDRSMDVQVAEYKINKAKSTNNDKKLKKAEKMLAKAEAEEAKSKK